MIRAFHPRSDHSDRRHQFAPVPRTVDVSMKSEALRNWQSQFLVCCCFRWRLLGGGFLGSSFLSGIDEFRSFFQKPGSLVEVPLFIFVEIDRGEATSWHDHSSMKI